MSNPRVRRHHPALCYTLLLLAAFLLFMRNPLLLLRGRVYAEEGTTYLRFAWETRWAHALFATHQGYYALVPNVATLLAARAIPLHSAGIFLAWCALLFQLLTVWVVIRCDAFHDSWTRVLAVLVVMLAAPSGEVWLNTINTQFYLAICTALVTISKPRRFHVGILLVSGLTGVVSCFLVPFLWIRAFTCRTRGAVAQAAVLSVCTMLQLIAVFHLGLRHVQHNVAYIVEACAGKNVLLAFGTSFPAELFGKLAMTHPSAGLIVAIILLASLALLLSRIIPIGGCPAVLLVAMAVWGEVCALFCGLDVGRILVQPYVNGRYFFCCNVCIGLALVLAWGSSVAGSRMQVITGCCLAALLISGLSDFKTAGWQTALGPDWRSQVNSWEHDSGTPIRIFPKRWRPLYLTADHPDLDLPDDIYDSTKAATAGP